MNKKPISKKFLIFLCGVFIFIIFVFAILILTRNKAVYKTTLYDSYAAAEYGGREEFGILANVFKVLEIQDAPNKASIITYLKDDSQTVYIALIEKYKKGYQYSRVSPTFNLGSSDNPANVSYEIAVKINYKNYYVSVGRVDKSYSAFSGDEELMVGVDRIFMHVNISEKPQIKFVKNE